MSNTPRVIKGDSQWTAQLHALRQFSRELESFVENSLFLSKCVKKGILRSIDKENINKKRTAAEKVQKLIARVEKFPRKYQDLLSVLKTYQTEKDQNIALNIEAAKSEKERNIAIEKLSQLVCHRICPILTGNELDCDMYQSLPDIVSKLTELTDTLKKFQTKAEDKNTAHQDSLSQLQQKQQQSQQTINQLQEEITRQGETIQTLQQEKHEILEQKETAESELENRKIWKTRTEKGKDLVHSKNKMLEPSKTDVPKYKFGNSSQESSHWNNNLSSQNLQFHTDSEASLHAHNNEVTANVNIHSQNPVPCQMSTVQGHLSPGQGQTSKEQVRTEEQSESCQEHFSCTDEEINVDLSRKEIFTTEKLHSATGQTASFSRYVKKQTTDHTLGEATETYYKHTSVSRPSSSVSILRVCSASHSTVSNDSNKMSDKRSDNIIANNNQTVHINQYENCTIINKYVLPCQQEVS